MKYRIALFVAVLALGVASVPASTSQMPIEEIKPGMIGVGRTVFEGSELQEFKVHILGVLRNVMGPRRNLILARLEGGPLGETGIVQGMSGSPVYIDGRLAGAVSYSLGAFAKEPIAGITPIGEMTESVTLPSRPATNQKVRLQLPITREGLETALRDTFARTRPFSDRPGDIEALGIPSSAAGQLAVMLRPIATPLVMSGFTSDVMDTLADVFRASGFVPVVSGSSQQSVEDSRTPLQPGDAVGVSLVTGDLSLGGVGTVTHVDGDRVYAFGHPFFNLGPTEFPMARAYVHTLVPSLLSSFKIASIGEVIGTFQQDRATAIAGTLGKGPTLIPLKIALESDRGLKKAFRYEVVNDQLFTPLLTYFSILNTLRSYEREAGAATFTVRGKATVKGYGNISFEDIFTGDAPSVGAATYVAAPMTFLLGNDLAPVEIEGVDITISSTEQPRTATIERVWLDDVNPRAGKTVPLKVLTRTYRGEEITRTLPIEIPANATGRLSILVADGTRLGQWEARELRSQSQPQSIAQMIRALNNARKNNRLYVRLLSSQPGAVVSGETLPSLPPSVLAIFEADRNGGNFIPLGSAPIGEWEISTEHVVRGSRLLTINVSPE